MRDKTNQLLKSDNVTAEVFVGKESDLENQNSFTVLQNAIGYSITGAMMVAVVVAGKVLEHGPVVMDALAKISMANIGTAAAYVTAVGTGIALLEHATTLIGEKTPDSESPSPK